MKLPERSVIEEPNPVRENLVSPQEVPDSSSLNLPFPCLSTSFKERPHLRQIEIMRAFFQQFLLSSRMGQLFFALHVFFACHFVKAVLLFAHRDRRGRKLRRRGERPSGTGKKGRRHDTHLCDIAQREVLCVHAEGAKFGIPITTLDLSG